MRLLFIRHGDPDYEDDALTPLGKQEAKLLVPRMQKEKVRDFYVSPLRRARQTAAPTLAALGRDAVELDWLKEFPARVDINGSPYLQKAFPNTWKKEDGTFGDRIAWDQMPATWKNDPAYYIPDGWRSTELAKSGDMEEVYDYVTGSFDALLEKYGYRREGNLYLTEMGNNDTIAFFCHFGLTCVLLSHLWGINNPLFLFHSLACAPTSVTEVFTEEREKGIVLFRATKIGDVSHLYAAGAKPSFACRFCEKYENDERH